MYRYDNGQIKLSDFQQPLGMELNENNRWVKKAKLIPWNEIENQYASLFKTKIGNVAKPLRLALGACIIQMEYGYSDEETAFQIQENPYLQYFCGYSGYDDSKLPFDPSLMVHFRKRLTEDILKAINEKIIQSNRSKIEKKEPPLAVGTGNSGTLILDATCAPSNIRYPQDISILNEAREKAEAILDELHKQKGGKKSRDYRLKAKKAYSKYNRQRRPCKKSTMRAIKEQLQYLRRDISIIEKLLTEGKQLADKQVASLATIRQIFQQQQEMYAKKTHKVAHRIVSVSEPFIRPVVRGKVNVPVEFGIKLDMSISDGWARLEYSSFEPYNEAGKLQEEVERYKEREGHYPNAVLADKIYRNRNNLKYCKERNIRLSGPALGRPSKFVAEDKKQSYIDECQRIEVERKFSLAKRKCGLGKITKKLAQTITHCVAMSIIVLNLRKIMTRFFIFINWIINEFFASKKFAIVQ